ncbi:MAG: hypothetical protein HRT47_11555 [Candidatus Caenarcaniphilales bacterium]|nr:hypothetical protein [Candidatus Caenarcaniphilales bacterium]
MNDFTPQFSIAYQNLFDEAKEVFKQIWVQRSPDELKQVAQMFEPEVEQVLLGRKQYDAQDKGDTKAAKFFEEHRTNARDARNAKAGLGKAKTIQGANHRPNSFFGELIRIYTKSAIKNKAHTHHQDIMKN